MPYPGAGFPIPPFQWPHVGRQWPAYNVESDQATGLIGWWPTLASSGAGKLRDLSGQGSDFAWGSGTDDPTWMMDPEQGAVLNYDGTNDWLEQACPIAYADPFTLTFWIKGNAVQAIKGFVNLQPNNVVANQICTGYFATSYNNFLFSRGQNSSYAVKSAGSVSQTAWHHFAVRSPGGNVRLKLFTDGLDDGADGGIELTKIGNNVFQLGHGLSDDYNANCRMAEVRLYDYETPDALIERMAQDAKWELHQLPRRLWRLGVVTPPVTIIPVVMHHYRSARL